jgi:type IV pilus assembly protein PilO
MAANILKKITKIPLPVKALALLAVVGTIFAWYYFSKWKQIEETITQITNERSSLERTLREQKSIADNLPGFQENTRKLEEDLRRALTQLPREQEIPALIRDIYSIGKKSGITFRAFEPQREVSRPLYAELPIRLQLQGTYHEIAVFFDRIGKLNRIVNISGLDVSITKADSESPELSVNCTATTFMFKGGGR